jgi:hypothetical protein
MARLLRFTVPQGHRHLKPTLKCYFRQWPADSSSSDIVFEFLAIMRSAPILPLLNDIQKPILPSRNSCSAIEG